MADPRLSDQDIRMVTKYLRDSVSDKEDVRLSDRDIAIVQRILDKYKKQTKSQASKPRRTGGMDMMKKKGYARGGAKMTKMRAGGGKMPMAKDPKTGKMVPAFAMDGKGKMRGGGTKMAMKKKGMARGGMKKKMMGGGMMKKKGMARGGTARRK